MQNGGRSEVNVLTVVKSVNIYSFFNGRTLKHVSNICTLTESIIRGPSIYFKILMDIV